MHYVRHWPEGLFIVFVMIIPVATASVMFHGSVIRWVLILAAAAVAGFVVWIGAIVLLSLLSGRGGVK